MWILGNQSLFSNDEALFIYHKITVSSSFIKHLFVVGWKLHCVNEKCFHWYFFSQVISSLPEHKTTINWFIVHSEYRVCEHNIKMMVHGPILPLLTNKQRWIRHPRYKSQPAWGFPQPYSSSVITWAIMLGRISESLEAWWLELCFKSSPCIRKNRK